MAVSECGSYLDIDHRDERDEVELYCHGTENEPSPASVDRPGDCGEHAVRRTKHPTDAHGRTWTTDDLEEILRGEDYDWDEAAALLRDCARPYLSDALAVLEEWAGRIRAVLDQAPTAWPSPRGSAQD